MRTIARRGFRLVVIAAVVASSGATAQLQEQVLPRVDAATIQPATPVESGGNTSTPQAPDLFSVAAVTLQWLMANAYQLPVHRIVGGPAWVASERFHVMAKASGVPTGATMRTLLRQLIEERFQLRTHRETREMPIYNLVFARSDHRLGQGLRTASV